MKPEPGRVGGRVSMEESIGGRVSMEESVGRRLSLEITRRNDISSGSGNLFFSYPKNGTLLTKKTWAS